jgi:hypothetical protein
MRIYSVALAFTKESREHVIHSLRNIICNTDNENEALGYAITEAEKSLQGEGWSLYIKCVTEVDMNKWNNLLNSVGDIDNIKTSHS